MKAIAFFASAAAAAALAVPATAQEAPRSSLEQPDRSSDKVLTQIAGKALNSEMDAATHKVLDGAPNDRAASGFRTESLQFSSKQGETDLSLAVSFDLGTYDRSRVENPRANFFSVSRTRVGLVATLPIDKNNAVQRLFSGDSLVSGSKLKLSVTRFSTSIGLGSAEANEAARKSQGDAYTACIGDFRSKQAGIAADQAHSKLLDVTTTEINIFATADPANERAAPFDLTFRNLSNGDAFAKSVAAFCYADAYNTNGIHNSGSLVKKYASDSYADFRSAYIANNAKLSFMGIDASFGREDHTYLDRAAFKLPSVPRTSWEAGAYYGQINSNLTFSWRIRGVYGQTYKDNDEAPLCRTVSIPAGTECIKGPDGAPLRQRTGLFSVEARKLVTVSDGTQIAIAPQITYKTKDSNIGVEVPVYLVPDEKGKLSGGLKAVYNSKGDEFAVGVFVGVPFSIFYN